MSLPLEFNLESLAALLSLTVMEIVLGIDNIVFIALLCGRLPSYQQSKARILGLGLAMITRIGLLYSLLLVMRLTKPLFTVFDHPFSGRDFILFGGGIFLVWKSVHEIHSRFEEQEPEQTPKAFPSFIGVLIQIAILDIVFSLDSVITAVGMANDLWIMATAIVIAVMFMMVFSGPLSDFIHNHPTVRMLAVSFLLLVGVMLIAEGGGQHIPKGYIYSAMGFSIFVEVLNLRLRDKADSGVEKRKPDQEPEQRQSKRRTIEKK
jgi:predicted tellurium resistance membrane protein TerC